MMTQRILYRSRSDRVVAGVCGGLAHYLGVDPVIVRLGFVLLTLTCGIGIPIYLLLALITPSATRAGVADIPYTAPYGSAERRETQKRLAAVALILLGAFFVLQNAGITHGLRLDLIGPLVLVGAGIYLIVRNRRPRYY